MSQVCTVQPSHGGMFYKTAFISEPHLVEQGEPSSQLFILFVVTLISYTAAVQ
jgi:hypothetical protein